MYVNIIVYLVILLTTTILAFSACSDLHEYLVKYGKIMESEV